MCSLVNIKKRFKKKQSLNDSDMLIMESKNLDEIQSNSENNKYSVNFDSVDEYFLKNMFSMLSVREMLSVERVCKRWQIIILELVAKQHALGTCWLEEEENNCLEWRSEHCLNGGDIRDAIVMNNGWFYDMTNEQSLTRLSYISKKCPDLKCIHISHCIINAECLKQLFKIMPKIECIHLRSIILKGIGTCTEDNHKKSPDEWNRIGEILGPKIRHLSLNPHYEHRMNELDAYLFIKHFTKLEEFRMGTHFERDVSGKFVSFLPKTLKLFYSLGRELSKEALHSLIESQGQSLTHFTFFSHPLNSADYFTILGAALTNLRRLRINLSYNEIILSTSSPISKLNKLQEFSVDLNTFTDNNVDDGLIWCFKDGLPSLHTLEITRACLSPRAFDSIQFCIPQIRKIILLCVEIQCFCYSDQILERFERYCCSICRRKGWRSLANLKQLRDLNLLNPYYRQEKPKPFHSELCEILPEFKCLNALHAFRYDITGVDLIKALDKLLNEQTDNSNVNIFTLTLHSIPSDLETKKLNKKLRIVYNPWMM